VPVAFVTQSVGDALRGFLAGSGGQAQVVIQSAVGEVPTVPKVVADFSSSGPTPFTRQLKPDISAPGVSILSSVPNAAKENPGPFAVFSGTSMAAPAVAGAAALLLQIHPTWTPQDVKSALMSTATAGFADSSQAGEASVLREGAGFLNVQAATDPGIVLAPSSLGFGLVDGGKGGTFSPTVAVRDIIGGGHWDITTALQPGAPAGVAVTAPPAVDLPANGTVGFPVTLTVPAGSSAGDVTGFVTLAQGPRVRRIPFWALVERPALVTAKLHQLPKPGVYDGNTRHGSDAVTTYRYPANLAGSGLPSHFTGPEQLWRFHLSKRVYNAGVTIESQGKVDAMPLLLAQRDENTVTGEAGLPLDVGPIPFTSGLPEPAAGMWFVQPGDYYVAVDSPRAKDAGAYRLRFWVNDLTPPKLKLLTPTVIANVPGALRFSISDAQSGVDPSTLFAIGNSLVPMPYDARTETATLRFSGLRPGTYRIAVLAADYAQSKDVIGLRPTTANTVFQIFKFKVLKKKGPSQ
jgi:hypothetical protein